MDDNCIGCEYYEKIEPDCPGFSCPYAANSVDNQSFGCYGPSTGVYCSKVVTHKCSRDEGCVNEQNTGGSGEEEKYARDINESNGSYCWGRVDRGSFE